MAAGASCGVYPRAWAGDQPAHCCIGAEAAAARTRTGAGAGAGGGAGVRAGPQVVGSCGRRGDAISFANSAWDCGFRRFRVQTNFFSSGGPRWRRGGGGGSSRFHSRVYAQARRRSATSERSESCNEELLLFLFQLDLATRLQRALNSEQYDVAQELREKIAQVDQEVARQRQEKMGTSSSKDEAQDTAITILRLKAELQTAIDGEDYPGAAQLKERISKAEAESLAASARALVLENITYEYRLGQRVQHKVHGYLGIVCGMDPSCCEGNAWAERAGINQLPRGKVQPFYQLLVDVREQPSLMVAYVAEDNLKPAEGDANFERFDHPYTYFLFFGMDGKGDFIPSKQLREKYNAARHELPWDEENDSPDTGGDRS